MNWFSIAKWIAVIFGALMVTTYAFLILVPQRSPDASWIFGVHLFSIPITVIAGLIAMRQYPIAALICVAFGIAFGVLQFW